MINENKYIKRHIDSILMEWKKDHEKKPLLIRGARLVGKSSAVRNFIEQVNY
jgi:uncharacterized protein